MIKKVINWSAYLTLIAAFIYGYFYSAENHELATLKILASNNLTLGKEESKIFEVEKNDTLIGYLTIGHSQGYGGPLKVAVIIDINGKIIATETIQSFDTKSFIAKLENNKYFDQYEEKIANQPFVLENDIEAISGATISSQAISNAIREASHNIAISKLKMEIPKIETHWKFSYSEITILLLFILSLFVSFLGLKKLRYLSLTLGLVFIGFMFNESLSLTHLGRFLLGYLPDIHTHFTWWLLMGGTFAIIIGWGKNVYCNNMCPFRATQVFLHKISGINLKLPTKLARVLAKTPFVLLWFSLILIFISANPTISSYEPFAMMFSLKGVGIQWYILPASLIGALFFSNFFCIFFCPVGGYLRWTLKIRKHIIDRFKKQ